MAMKHYWVYMITNANNTVIYTGVTNDIERRVRQHKGKTCPSFTQRYNLTKLVYYEGFGRIRDAIVAEKRIKAGSRAKKIKLIGNMNSDWRDLYDLKIASLRSQ